MSVAFYSGNQLRPSKMAWSTEALSGITKTKLEGRGICLLEAFKERLEAVIRMKCWWVVWDAWTVEEEQEILSQGTSEEELKKMNKFKISNTIR